MKKLILIILAAQMVVFGCQSPRGDADAKGSAQTDEVFKSEQLDLLLPSPGEFFAIVDAIDLGYEPSIINPIIPPNNYTLYRSQGLNFGVYLADFSYLLLFDKQSEAIRYLHQIQELASLLGVEEYFDDEFFNKLLSNLSNPDTVRAFSIEQSSAFFNRMETVGNKDLVVLITSGSIIETMYIVLNTIDEAKVTDEVVNTVIDLAYLFDSFYLHFKLSKPNLQELDKLSADLQELRDVITSFSITQTSKAIRKDGMVHLSSDINHEVNGENLSKMKAIVQRVRENIVNQSY
jgi:hypothetical protein